MFETTEVVEGAIPVFVEDGMDCRSAFWMTKIDGKAEIVACVPPTVNGAKAWFSVRDSFKKKDLLNRFKSEDKKSQAAIV